MTAVKKLFEPLEEEQRLAYLKAMGIVNWVPKSELNTSTNEVQKNTKLESSLAMNAEPRQPVEIEESKTSSVLDSIIEPSLVTGRDQAEQGQQSTEHPNLDNSSASSAAVADCPPAKVEESTSSNPEQSKTEQAKTEKTPEEANFSHLEQNQKASENSVTKSDGALCFSTSQYLKMVNWQHEASNHTNARQLLIVCRHQIDQPASSFAKRNSPSQFMLDYINALLNLLHRSPIDLSISLGHLSEAGLSSDSIKMDQILESSKPDLVLVLGDETVNQLANRVSDVAQLRGRTIVLGDKHRALVSYHPFSLIENPSLKSLAMNDLVQISQYFRGL
jgi:hypothetical protein